jgi:hypothetical protein
MGDAWFTEVADELARCLVDARKCTECAESLLESLRHVPDAEAQRVALAAVAVPAAVSRVMIELIDHPPQLALAAARLLRDSAEDAASALTALGGRTDGGDAIRALRAASESAARLLDAAG